MESNRMENTDSRIITLTSEGLMDVNRSAEGFLVRAMMVTPDVYARNVLNYTDPTPDILEFAANELKGFIPRMTNRNIRLSHIPPEKAMETNVGIINNAFWDESANAPVVEFLVYDGTHTGVYEDGDSSISIQDQISMDLTKPVSERFFRGVSIGVNPFPKREIYELSLARNPVCKQCVLSQNEEEVILVSDSSNDLEERISNLQKQLEAREERIRTLEEDKNTAINDATEMLKQLEQVHKDYQEIKAQQSLQYRERLVTLEGFDLGSEDGMKRLDCYKAFNNEQLKFIEKGLNKAIESVNRKVNSGFGSMPVQIAGLDQLPPIGEPTGDNMDYFRKNYSKLIGR